jgi:hypothetical protein
LADPGHANIDDKGYANFRSPAQLEKIIKTHSKYLGVNDKDIANVTTGPTPARLAGSEDPSFGPGKGGARLDQVPTRSFRPSDTKKGGEGTGPMHLGDYKPDFEKAYRGIKKADKGLPPTKPMTSRDPDMVRSLVHQAKRAIADAGLPLDEDTVRDFIKSKFENGKYSSKYDSVKDFFMGGSQDYPQSVSDFTGLSAGADKRKISNADSDRPATQGTQSGKVLSKDDRDPNAPDPERDVSDRPNVGFTKVKHPTARKIPGGKEPKKKTGAAPYESPDKSKEESENERLEKKKKDKSDSVKKAREDEDGKKKESEGKVKVEHYSLSETLLCGDKEKETEKKTANWDKAKPAKQQKFEPKLTLKELFK